MTPVAPAEPPPLPLRVSRPGTPLLAGVGAILATIVARRVTDGDLPAITCPLFRWTGIPCPGCGGTRCLGACGSLDLTAALRWNPLVALTAAALLGWAALALADARLADHATLRLRGFFTPGRIAMFIALNWLYLCWALPR